MKKTIVFLVTVLSLALFVAGCGGGTTETATTEETAAEEAVAEEETATETAETTTTEETAAEEAVAEEETATETAETIEVAGCTDSDGGKNYDVAGDLVDARGVTDSDRCSQNENFPARLYESYCEEDGNHGRETYECPTGKCAAGACVAEESSSA